MGFDLDPDILIAVISAVGIGLTFCVVGLLLTGRAGGRRYQRRLNSMQERAQGIATSEWAAARSLSRQQSTTRIDRFLATGCRGAISCWPASNEPGGRQHRQIRDDCDRSSTVSVGLQAHAHRIVPSH
jgi:hypothetical protein